MLQTIMIDGKKFTIFYDNGCGDFLIRHDAVKRLGNYVRKECDGPTKIGGVGGISAESPHGIYSVNLPLANGEYAKMSGVCLNQLTHEFPLYPLTGKVENDIREYYSKTHGDAEKLPKLPELVGGQVDIMIGIRYLRYFPELICKLPTGLSIYQSQFENFDGTRGVVGGPHRVFSSISNTSHSSQAYFLQEHVSLRLSQERNKGISLLGFSDDKGYDANISTSGTISQKLKNFENIEKAGSEITYRCINCRDCKTCKSNGEKELMSIREEIEQNLIEKSVRVEVESRSTVAKLPIMHQPEIKLAPNEHIAKKVFDQQIKKLNKNPKDKLDIITSEQKLQDLGFVEYVRNLSEEDKQILQNSPVKNFFPWRAVWKESSLSTPCRLIFDASQPTDSGFSLNDILPKGQNNMNKLVEVFLRWRSNNFAFHTDIRKMYNTIKLLPNDWCFQRYLWQENLDANKPVEEKVIKTMIYGVKASANISECGLRKTANLSKCEFPRVH